MEARWALTLSGGGLRATLFHLGVIRRLWLGGDLGKVKALFAVSGGAIIAAHIRLNWTKYNGTPNEFDHAAREILNFCGRDIRGRVVRRTALCWLSVFPLLSRLLAHIPPYLPGASILARWSIEVWPSSWLIKEYDRFYKRATLREFNPVFQPIEPSPRLHILSTSLSTGELCVFNENYLVVRKRAGQPVEIPAENAKVALAVASSSAYPALFSPILVNAPILLAPPDKLPEGHYLSDGGLFDNLGVEELHNLIRADLSFDRVIVSDAGAPMTIDLDRQAWGFFKRAIRTTDVIMSRASDGVIGKLKGNSCYTMLRIHDTLDNPEVSRNAQMTIGAVRTDLDDFDARERNLITNHGFQIAGQALYPDGNASDSSSESWFPEPHTYRGPLIGSNLIRWSRLFRWKDWCTWANLILAIIWIYCGVYSAYFLSGKLTIAYLDHEHQQFLHACDEAGLDHEKTANIRQSLTEFWETDTPSGVGKLPAALNLHRATSLHNYLAGLFGLSSPFPSLRSRVTKPQDLNAIDTLHQIGEIWKSDQKERYEQLRDDTYLTVLRITDELVKEEKRNERVERLIRDFYKLYWGRMVALESRAGLAVGQHSSVETRMVSFNLVLSDWKPGFARDSAVEEGKKVDPLASRRDALRYRMFEELRALHNH